MLVDKVAAPAVTLRLNATASSALHNTQPGRLAAGPTPAAS